MEFPVSNEGIRDALDWLLGQADEQGIARPVAHRMAVIVDEYCSNLIRHDPAVNAESLFVVNVEARDRVGLLRISENATPFDPTRYRREETRQIGGQGIVLMNGLATRLQYRSENGKNLFEAEVSEGKAS